MAEVVEVFEEQVRRALEALVARKPPKDEKPIQQILYTISTKTDIAVPDLISKLVMAGYNAEDIFEFLRMAGAVPNTDDWVKYRMAVYRAVAKLSWKIGKHEGVE